MSSVKALDWALRQDLGGDSDAKAALIVLADYVDDKGRIIPCWRRNRTIDLNDPARLVSRYFGWNYRKTHEVLRRLADKGLIIRGKRERS